MFTALHPWLLAGTAAVAIPVLIHLLLKRRPRPQPWAAMRWLAAASKRAERSWRLTHLLLLFLRCLAVALAALALARPAIEGLGAGDRLVIAMDVTASMGERADDPGSLAALRAALAGWDGLERYRRVAVVALGAETMVVADGTPAAARAALAALEATSATGGIDQALARGQPAGPGQVQGAARLAALLEGTVDVLIASDFQQDDGTAVRSAVAGARRVVALAAAPGEAGGAITGIETPDDLVPGAPGQLVVAVDGPAGGIALGIDDGPLLPGPVPTGRTTVLPLPPLTVGRHVLKIRLERAGLRYDDRAELPVEVRAGLPALIVQDRPDYLGAALLAERQLIAGRTCRATALASEPLPVDGIVALRTRVAEAARLTAWVDAGGILWAPYELLLEDPALAPLVAGIRRTGAADGGPFRCGDAELDASLSVAGRAQVPLHALPPGTDTLLTAGTVPVVVAIPRGRGRVVVELIPLAGDRDFEARGATPWWAVRAARRQAASAVGVPVLVAGASSGRDGSLERGGATVRLAPGAALTAGPGIWAWIHSDGTKGGDVCVLPDPAEGRTGRQPPNGAGSDPELLLPGARGTDLGPWLVLALIALLISEGLVARRAAVQSTGGRPGQGGAHG